MKRGPLWRPLAVLTGTVALVVAAALAAPLDPAAPWLPGAATVEAAPYPAAITAVSVRGGPGMERVSMVLGVTNTGGAFQGWLEVSGTERRALIAVDVQSGSSRLAAAAYPVDTRGTVRVRLLDADESPRSAWVSGTVDYSTHALVVGERRAETGGFLMQSGWLTVDQAERIPADPSGLAPYTYLVVAADGETPAASLAEGDGWSAVRLWVSNGGILVVAAPAAVPAAVTEGALDARFGPAYPLAGASVLTVTDSMGLGGMGAPALPAGVVVSPVDASGASYTAALEDGTVVLAGSRLGRGLVLFVGVPPRAGAGSSGGEGGPVADEVRFFWENLVLSAPRGGSYWGSPWTDPPHLFVTSRVPSLVWTGLASLLYTLVVGVGLFVGLRRSGRRDAVWYVVPAVVLVTTFAVLGASLAVRGAAQEVLIRRSVSVDDTGVVDARTLYVGAYAPFGARFGAVPPPGYAPAAVETYDAGFERPYLIRDASARGGPVTVEDVRVAPGSGRSVAFTAGFDRGGPAASAGPPSPFAWTRSDEGDAVRWTVTNIGTDVLRRLILAGDGVFTLPDLAPGGSISFLVGAGPPTGEGIVPVTEEPPRPRSRDYLEWEAGSRLRAEWAQSGQFGDYGEQIVAPPPGVDKGSGFSAALPEPGGIPVRLVAFAADRGPLPELSGLSSGAAVSSVVVYEVVLR